MSKVILFLSFFGIAILFIFGLLAPNSPVMWMASTSSIFAALRLVMMAALVALLATNPPRNVYLRALIGAFCLLLVSWSLGATYQNQMKFLDTLSLLQFSISAGLVVLERDLGELDVFVRSPKAKQL